MLSCTPYHSHSGRSLTHLLIYTHDYRHEIFHERFHAGTNAQTLSCKLVLRDFGEHVTLKRCIYSAACEHLHTSVSEDKHIVLGICADFSFHLLRSVFAIAHWRKGNNAEAKGPTYSGKEIRFITKLFKDTEINVSYRTKNTIKRILKTISPIESNDKYKLPGVCKLKCNYCPLHYIGQTGRSFNTRFKEHVKAIRYNKENSG
jgi:hypothetical protein